MPKHQKRNNTKNLMMALCEGLLGYIIYMARTGMQEAYSEYLLYDPIIRIAKDKQWEIESEFAVEKKETVGDKKRIDFLFKSSFDNLKVVGLEVKYLKSDTKKPNLTNDINKLKSVGEYVSWSRLHGFILLAGRISENLAKSICASNSNNLFEDEIYAEKYFTNQFGVDYGVAVFNVIDKKS